MSKVVYEYSSVKLPTDAKDMIDVLHAEKRKDDPRIRKADLWLEAVNLLKEQNNV